MTRTEEIDRIFSDRFFACPHRYFIMPRLSTMLSHCFYKELLRCSLVTSFCNKAFKNLTFMINGTPKVKPFTVNFDENLIQMPLPVRVVIHPLLPNFRGKLSAKSVHPKPHSFIANINSTFVEDIFNLAKAERVADVVHYSQADNLG